MTNSKIPRGIRNNNPLNIRIGNTWLGEVKKPTDNEFEQFVHVCYGLRAGFILLKRYINRYKLNTIEKIISRWAPHNENNTRSYINQVARCMNIDPDTPLLYEDKDRMCALVYEMVYVENGQHIKMSEIVAAYRIAN